MAFHLYSRGRATGVYLQNAPIFPTNLPPDIRWGFDAIWNVSIITTTTSTFEYTIDGGITFFPLGVATANKELIANIKADDKDSFNLRITDVAGGTVFRIVVSIAPEDIMRSLSPIQIQEPLKVDICPVTCDVPVDIQNQPISVTETEDPKDVAITGQPIAVTQSANPLPVDICPVTCEIDVDINSISFGTIPVSITGQPISVTQTANPLPVSFAQPITVTQSANPLPVDICPVSCEIDVDINSISFGTIPVSITGQPISVTETADPQNVLITGQPIQIDIFAQSFSPLLVDICPVSCDLPVINGSVSPLIVNIENPTGTKLGETLVNLTNSAYTTPNDVFPALSPTGTSVGDAVTIRIQWSAIIGGILSYTLNDSDFVAFNDQNTLKEDSSHVFDVVVDHGDSFTLQFDKTTTITFLRVVQLV